MSLSSVGRGSAESRVLLGIESLSLAGDQLAKVAITVLVFDRTGSASLAAAAHALTFLPALAGGLGLARIADLWPRREVLAVGLMAQGVAIAAGSSSASGRRRRSCCTPSRSCWAPSPMPPCRPFTAT